jgi:hypothetical protein
MGIREILDEFISEWLCKPNKVEAAEKEAVAVMYIHTVA